MFDQIHIRKLPGTYVLRAGGAVLGESAAALEYAEPGAAALVFLPLEDIEMAFIEPSQRSAALPTLGEVQFYDIVAKSGRISDAARAFPAPEAAAARLADHLTFDPARVTVERI